MISECGFSALRLAGKLLCKQRTNCYVWSTSIWRQITMVTRGRATVFRPPVCRLPLPTALDSPCTPFFWEDRTIDFPSSFRTISMWKLGFGKHYKSCVHTMDRRNTILPVAMRLSKQLYWKLLSWHFFTKAGRGRSSKELSLDFPKQKSTTAGHESRDDTVPTTLHGLYNFSLTCLPFLGHVLNIVSKIKQCFLRTN